MSEPEPDAGALQIAEEILRTIYGDDLKGCPVTLEAIGSIVAREQKKQAGRNAELVGLYTKVVEAVDLLSTPPAADNSLDPNQLRSLLSERLDTIHALTTRTRETTARFAREAGGSESESAG